MNACNEFLKEPSRLPVTFTYDGVTYCGFGENVKIISLEETTEADGVRTVLRLAHPAIPAIFEVEGKNYPAYRACDLCVTIRNEGAEESAVFSDLFYNLSFTGDHAILRGLDGDAVTSWYTPYEIPLSREGVFKESVSGRPSHGVFPYFDIVHGNGGTLVALGWPGRWTARVWTEGDVTCFTAGQRKVATTLRPGESLRMPLLACVDYDGREESTSTAAWRRFMIDCNMPRLQGQRLPTYLHSSTMSDGHTTDSVKRQIEDFYAHGIDLEMYWMDAGWYTGLGDETVSWPMTGSLRMDTARYPDRMAEINRLLREHGTGLLLWFEPEVVRLNSEAFLRDNPDFKPEWLLGRVFRDFWLEGDIIDFGNPEAVDWVFGRVCKVIDDAGGLLCYRQDFNCDPAAAWDDHDGEGRIGMTENRFVCGYLAYWDRLLERYPDLFIDSCASGGGRNDLETMRRSVPLHYTDYFDGPYAPENNGVKLSMVMELYKWFPYFKNVNYVDDASMYQLRLNYTPAWQIRHPGTHEELWALYSRAIEEYRQIRPFYYADYYPLTPNRRPLGAIMAWEFFDKTADAGFVQVFRTGEEASMETTLCLQGLNPATTYTLRDTDGRLAVTATGEALAAGLCVTLPEAPDSMVILIGRA